MFSRTAHGCSHVQWLQVAKGGGREGREEGVRGRRGRGRRGRGRRGRGRRGRGRRGRGRRGWEGGRGQGVCIIYTSNNMN